MELSGNLKDFSLPEIIQSLEMARKTGKLDVLVYGLKYAIFFEEGKIIHAQSPFAVSHEGLYDLFLERDGEFKFITNIIMPPKTMNESNSALLLEGMRRFDELKSTLDVVGNGKKQAKTSHEMQNGNVTLNKEEWNILTLLSKGKTLKEVLVELEISYYSFLKIIESLLSKKLISF